MLEEMASLDRLRRLVANLRSEDLSGSTGRVAEFPKLAERRLASREAALPAEGLDQRSEKQKLFGDDYDHAFRPPYGYLLIGRWHDANWPDPRTSSPFQTTCCCYCVYPQTADGIRAM